MGKIMKTIKSILAAFGMVIFSSQMAFAHTVPARSLPAIHGWYWCGNTDGQVAMRADDQCIMLMCQKIKNGICWVEPDSQWYYDTDLSVCEDFERCRW
jgi:hypothetical protein